MRKKPKLPNSLYVCKGCGKVDTEQFETCNCAGRFVKGLAIVATLLLFGASFLIYKLVIEG